MIRSYPLKYMLILYVQRAFRIFFFFPLVWYFLNGNTCNGNYNKNNQIQPISVDIIHRNKLFHFFFCIHVNQTLIRKKAVCLHRALMYHILAQNPLKATVIWLSNSTLNCMWLVDRSHVFIRILDEIQSTTYWCEFLHWFFRTLEQNQFEQATIKWKIK